MAVSVTSARVAVHGRLANDGATGACEPNPRIRGDVAQLGEHLVRNEGVGGSNPLISTKLSGAGPSQTSARGSSTGSRRRRIGSAHEPSRTHPQVSPAGIRRPDRSGP